MINICLLIVSNLGAYYGVSVSGIKYKMKHNIINVTKFNRELQDLKFDYSIAKSGVVTALETDILKDFESNSSDTLI